MSIVLPSQCAVCRGWSSARLCTPCLARFAPPTPRCPRCALPGAGTPCGECMRVPPPVDRVVAAFDYAFPWDGLIAAFKFRRALDLGAAFARVLADAVHTAQASPPGLVLPLPLGRARLRERGYNQAWELARRVARHLGCDADHALLARCVDTPHQLSLPRERRAANVRGSFTVGAREAARLRGVHVALVDDVMTTGATLHEAARVLRDAGAASVQGWVLARTPAPA